MSSAAPSPAAAAPCASTATHSTPPEHRRERKAWTEEEKREFWQKKKADKKERKKAAAADRQRAQQSEWEKLSPTEQEARRAAAAAVHERRREADAAMLQRCEAQLADPHVPTLVFDLSFAWCMTVANTKSTVSQVKFSYSALRTAGFPFRPAITSLTGKEAGDTAHDAAAQAEVLTALHDFEGFRRFPPVVAPTQHWSDLFAASQVVFLTADAPEVLTGIEPDTAYVIGAFVDHNAHKGLSYAAAQRHGVRAARLPIKESVELGNRCKVLTINHVVDVLIAYERLRAAGTPDWTEAIDTALPTRRTQQIEKRRHKRGRLSGDTSDVEASEDDEGDKPGDGAAERLV